ncbi:hypothetical protein BH09BAC6_BH09BAC6_16820 [soil metagenome]
MNWGKGIIAGMLIFMLFIISMCVYMFRMPADEYDHQYYEKGLNFDKDLDKEKQVFKDNARPVIQISGKQAKIVFTAPANGTIRFIRPSSQALDKTYPLDTNTGNTASVGVKELVSGQWKMVLEWTSNNKKYLYGQEIYIK